MAAKPITAEYVADLCHRIEQGETPQKNTDISRKEFLRQMLPHVENFLAQGYTYKEISTFLGQVSVTDLKKAVAKEDAETARKKKVPAGKVFGKENLKESLMEKPKRAPTSSKSKTR